MTGAGRDRDAARRRKARFGTSPRRVLLSAALTALAAPGQAQSPTSPDALGKWLDDVAACVSPAKTPASLSLAIVGPDARQTALSQAQAEEARLAIEQQLLASGRVRLAPAGDVVRIKALREGTTGLSGPEAEEQIRQAFGGDAAVFFADPSRQGEVATFRLQAITRAADCKATSAPLQATVRAAPGLSDIDQVMQGAVRNLTQSVPDLAAVSVCPVASQSGFSACSAALGERLVLALDGEARSPTRALRGRTLEIRKGGEAACAASGPEVTAHAAFAHDSDNRSWMSLEFRRNGAVIAPTGRTRIDPAALGCDPTPRPFLDHVFETARRDRKQLDMFAAANPFHKGQRLDVRIEAKAPMQLYCWVLAPDETGFVALPVRGEESRSRIAVGAASYPYGFGLSDIVLEQPFENLFQCFGVAGDLPEALRARWLAAAPDAAGAPKLLSRADLLDLMQQTRTTPGVAEAVTRIIVR